MEKNGNDIQETPEIPTAGAMVERIKADLAEDGKNFRKEHPDLVRRMAELLAGVKCGTEIYIDNRHGEYNIDEVTRCLHGLGYEVKPAHPMVSNPHGAFRILWWLDDKPNPYLG